MTDSTIHRKNLTDIERELSRARERLGATVLHGILNEAKRLQESGRTVTLTLHPDFVAVYIHEGKKCTDVTARSDDADGLINLLEHLEKVGNTPVYDLEEEVAEDVETVS